jgi:putative oxidoreductase
VKANMQIVQTFVAWSAAAAPFERLALGVALLILRLVVGTLMAAHGAQKLFGWFGGDGLAATAHAFDALGFRPGRLFAALAASTELASGALVILGLLGPIGPALMLSVMIVAAVSVHWPHGLFASTNGIELALLYAAAAFGLAFTGPGYFSLDEALGLTPLWTWPLAVGALTVGAIGGVANLTIRRPVTRTLGGG